MACVFHFGGGDRATIDDHGWTVDVYIDHWDERLLGEVSLALTEVDSGSGVGSRDHFGRHDAGRSDDELGTIDCTIGRGSGAADALPFVCTGIRSNVASAETRHRLAVRLPTGGTIAQPQWSDPIAVPLRGETAGESAEEGSGYEVDLAFKNRHDIPAAAGAAAVAAGSIIAPEQRRRATPRTVLHLDFPHCASCWVLEARLGLFRRPSTVRTDKIVGGNVWVGGKFFIDWFNDDFAPSHRRAPGDSGGANDAGFNRGRIPYRRPFFHFYEHSAEVWASELSLAQFVCIYAMVYNESPTYLGASEGRNPAYWFEYRFSARRKNSYNRFGWSEASYDGQPRHRLPNGNFAAGDQLRRWWQDVDGKGRQMRADGLTEERLDFDAWNGVWWPYRETPLPYVDDPPREACPPYEDNPPNATLTDDPVLARWVRQTDFCKLRGRGFTQMTGRSNYINTVRPPLRALGYPDFDELTDEELQQIMLYDARFAFASQRCFFQGSCDTGSHPLTALATQSSGQLFGQVGTNYSGGSATHKVRWRCEQLLGAIERAGWECRPVSAADLAQIRSGGSDRDGISAVQRILADLGYGGHVTGTFDEALAARIGRFHAYFSIRDTPTDRLALETAEQLLKWHEARHARGIATAPAAGATATTPPASSGAEPIHPPAMAVEASDDDDEHDGATGDDAAATPAATAAPTAPASSPRAPPPYTTDVTEATVDEHDTVTVDKPLVSAAMTHCEDLQRVAGDVGWRHGQGEPLWPGDSRATPAAIRALQTALCVLGYDLGRSGDAHDGVDGQWSARGRTVRAVQQHQRLRGAAWAGHHDPNVGDPVRTDGRVDWATLYIIDRDARAAEGRAAAAGASTASTSTASTASTSTASTSTTSTTSTSTASTSTASTSTTSSGAGAAACDKRACRMTREEALRHLLHLQADDGLAIRILDREHGGLSAVQDGAFGVWPDVRVNLPSPCYGVVVRAVDWSRAQIDPRMAVGVARLCQWLHERGVIAILHDTVGGFLGSGRENSPHGHGCALDLSSFDFDADHAASDHGGHERLRVQDVRLWPRYDAQRFRVDGDPGLIAAGWRYSSGAARDRWRSGDTHRMCWTNPANGLRGREYTFHTNDSSAPFERLEARAGWDDMLVRAGGVPAELDLFANASLLDKAVGHPDAALPFGRFITDLYRFVQGEFLVNDAMDGTEGHPSAVALEEFNLLVNPCHPRLGHGKANHHADGSEAAASALGTNGGPRARFGHQDHLHLQVQDIRPYLPYFSNGEQLIPRLSQGGS